MRGQGGRGDHPVHIGEAFGKERHTGFQCVVFRFEPCRETAAGAIAGQFSEPHEGMHLVNVAAHVLGQQLQPPPQRIGGGQRIAIAPVDPPESLIQQRSTVG